MSSAILLVARREITERTRGRAFLISTLALVAVVLAGVVLPGLEDRTKRVDGGLAGATPAALAGTLRAAARSGEVDLGLRRYPSVAAGESAVRDGQADVLIVAGRQLVWKSEPDAEIAAAVTAAIERVRFAERAGAPHQRPCAGGC